MPHILTSRVNHHNTWRSTAPDVIGRVFSKIASPAQSVSVAFVATVCTRSVVSGTTITVIRAVEEEEVWIIWWWTAAGFLRASSSSIWGEWEEADDVQGVARERDTRLFNWIYDDMIGFGADRFEGRKSPTFQEIVVYIHLAWDKTRQFNARNQLTHDPWMKDQGSRLIGDMVTIWKGE